MSRLDEGAWPLDDDPRDPQAAPWPDDDLGYADLRSLALPDPPSRAAYQVAAAALQDHLGALLRGDVPFDVAALHARARAAWIVPDDDRVDRRPVRRAPRRMTEEEIARIALDQEPAAGLFGPDRALGPWAGAARADDARDRTTLLYALAHWAAGRPAPVPPLQKWRRANVTPPLEDRRAAEAVVRAPLAAWRVTSAAQGWWFEDRIGLAPHRRPDRPIPLPHAAGFGRLVDGATVLARVVLLEDGTWTAFGPLVLPGALPDAALRAVVAALLIRRRLRARRSTREDMLRDDAADVCRLLHVAAGAPG